MQLERYFRILRGTAKPRFLTARKSGFLTKQLQKISKAEVCPFCNRRHKPPALKARIITKTDDPTFRNAIAIVLGARGTKTPVQAAAAIGKAFKRGRKTVIILGDIRHGIPFIFEMLEKTEVPVAIVLDDDPTYSEKAATLFKRIIDVYALTLRWADPGCAEHFNAAGYVESVQKNLKHAAKSETVVRIPTMPGHLECDAKSSLDWISKNVPNVVVQVMLVHKLRAVEHSPELSRIVTIAEFSDVVAFAQKLGLRVESVMKH